MSKKAVSLGLTLLLLCLVTASSGAPARAWGEPTLVRSIEYPFFVSAVKTDGRFVLWVAGQSRSPGSTSSTLNIIDRLTGEVSYIDIGAGGYPVAIDMDIDNGLAVLSTGWNHYHSAGPHGVFAKDLYSGETWQLSSVERPGQVAVIGSTIIWVEREDVETSTPTNIIWMQDVAAPDAAPSALYTAVAPSTRISTLSAANGRVVWEERDETAGRSRLVMRAIAGGESILAERDTSIPFDLSGDLLVYPESGSIVVRNLLTATSRQLALDVKSSATDGRYIFWMAGTSIQAYDTLTDASFDAFVPDQDDEGKPIVNIAAANGVLTWSRSIPREPTEGTVLAEIHAADIADHLPSSPRPSPDAIHPHWTYFPETGHYLAWGFRDYWNANGGLPVFGYPLTEEYLERNADTGEMYMVQFTERQRFEWHPANAAPYTVLLGRLGAELLMTQGRDWREFSKADPAAAHYFTETGHAIDPRFWEYWSSHGLEFGDSGVSFGESLALFGYPLSEPMLETNADGHTVWTQYFERAVFEWHPDNPEPYRVLLRRLGAEALTEREWN